MKRLSSLILTMVLLLSLMPTGLFSITANAATSGYYTYKVTNEGVEITDFPSDFGGRITIPSTIDGYPVTSISNYAFAQCANLTSITIPNSVTSIGRGAFVGCRNLESMTIPFIGGIVKGESQTDYFPFGYIFGEDYYTGSIAAKQYGYSSSNSSDNVWTWERTYYIPESLKSVAVTGGDIQYGAFSGCSNLTSIIIPDNVTSIGEDAFYKCSRLTSITIPDSVTSIGNGAFNRCGKLRSITIPDSVTSIGAAAFYNCEYLKSITIGNSLSKINVNAFYNCYSLTDVWYKGSNERRESIRNDEGNSYLYDAIWHYNTCLDSHTYSSNCDSSCNNCEWVRDIDAIHVYDHDCDTECNLCGNIRTITHNYKWIIDEENSCSADGSKHKECSVCHVTQNIGTVIPATGNHTYDNSCDTACNICGYTRTTTHDYEWIVDQQNNCGVDGSKHEECTVCHTTQNVGIVIPATGYHRYDNSCDAECNVCGHSRIINHTYNNVCDAACNICGFVRTVPEHSYTLNGNHTCDICKYSKVPDAPTIESKTNNSVTLIATNGFEYSKDGTTWQSSNVFISLSANTTYTFYQRVKASGTALASEASQGTSVTFKAAQTAPSAPIVSSYTDTMVTLVAVANGEYSADGTTWQTSHIFTGLSPAMQYTFYQRYAETESHEASDVSAEKAITTDKAKQTQIPGAPTVESFTSSEITLIAVDGCEYSRNGTTWQPSNVFSGLSCGTEYSFYQRYKETTTTYAGKSSVALVTTTDKGTQSRPSAPTLSSKTYNSVILYARNGYEYSSDGITWQTSTVFTGLEAETNYMFYQRKAETSTYYASEASTALTVKTDEAPTYASGDLTGDGKINSLDGLLLMRYLNGWNVNIASPEAMDVNGDGKVNSLDGLILMRYLNGWNVNLG